MKWQIASCGMNIHDWLKLLQQNWSWKAVHNIFFNSLPFSECQMHYRRPLAFWLSISYNLRSSAAHTASAICLLLNPFSLSPVALRLKYTERRCPGPRQFQAGILTKPWTRRSSMKTCRPSFFYVQRERKRERVNAIHFFLLTSGQLGASASFHRREVMTLIVTAIGQEVEETRRCYI